MRTLECFIQAMRNWNALSALSTGCFSALSTGGFSISMIYGMGMWVWECVWGGFFFPEWVGRQDRGDKAARYNDRQTDRMRGGNAGKLSRVESCSDSQPPVDLRNCYLFRRFVIPTQPTENPVMEEIRHDPTLVGIAPGAGYREPSESATPYIAARVENKATAQI